MAVIIFGLSGPAGLWPLMGARIVCVGLLLLPGLAVATALGEREPSAGASGIALAFALSIAVFNGAAMAARALGMSLGMSVWLIAGLFTCIGVAALVRAPSTEKKSHGVRVEWIAVLIVVAILLPAVTKYAGGGIDDWWDLAYVRALADRTSIDFREPMLGTGLVHPRFSWSSWLLLQATVHEVVGTDAVLLQSEVLAPLVCFVSVAAVALLARAVFGASEHVLVVLAVLAVPAWAYGTDALPYFTRLHQDKFVAALVLMPALVATVLRYITRPTARGATLVFLCATALCSVHTLIFGIGALGALSCVAAGLLAGRERRGWYTVRNGPFRPAHAAVVAGLLGLTMVPPLWQAWHLREWFAGQGVGLSMPDNPVVRAHLALGRLIAPGDPYMVVHPGAVFGAVGLVAMIGACLALRRKRPGDRFLVALTLVPVVFLFVPLVAAAIGAVTVPWMLYRVGWLIPQPLLFARAGAAAFLSKARFSRWIGVAVWAALIFALSAPTAADRLRRRMDEHPYSYETLPRGTTLAVYRFLGDSDRRGPVLAPVGFSNLVPAMTGRPVLAFSERGTLVFAGSEPLAYERLRDRAMFFSCATDAATRRRIAHEYGVEHVVFRRRYRTAGDEAAWLERSTADGLLLADDPTIPVDCAVTEERLSRGLPLDWPIVYANHDYFVVETDVPTVQPSTRRPESHSRRWLDILGVETDGVERSGEVLASATGYPGGEVVLKPVPVGLGIGDELLWAGGGAIWDDGPVEVSIELRLADDCPVSAVEIVPYLETGRREAFEVRIDDHLRVMQARDGVPMRFGLEGRVRDRVRVDMRSVLGLPFGVSDLRLVGDRGACEGGWRPLARPRIVGRPLPLASYFTLVGAYPRSPRAAIDLADRLKAASSSDDAMAVLRRALSREGGQAAPWIQLGLLLDDAGRFDEARAAYRRARAADSNSAWANGCLAWADVRAGSPLASLWHAWRALQLDPRYADAVTIAALAWDRLGFDSLSMRALDRAIEMAPRRGWPYLEKARQLAKAGRREDARALLRRYRALVPDDPATNRMLSDLRGDDTSTGG